MHDTANLHELIDQRRALAAQLAGIEMRICLACGDRDGAYRHMKEMQAQTQARIAASEVGQEDVA